MQKRKSNSREELDEEEMDENHSQQEYHPIDILQDHGINNGDIKKLIDAGYNSLESIAYTPKKNILVIKGLSDAKVEKIVKVIYDILKLGIQPCAKALEERKRITRITSGSKQLDSILGGGFEANSITELFGEFRTGKTQICHTLCVTCQLPKSDGGGEGKAIYIDTEGTFRPEKLAPIAERFGLDPKEVIENVFYARAYNSDHQNRLLLQVCGLMCEHKFSLLIVDFATALYRKDY